MNEKNRNSGFTLIEAMIVVVIIGIVVSIAVPNILEWLPAHRLKAATKNVFSSMQEAKFQAIKDNTTVVLVFDTTVSPGNYFFDTNTDDTWQPGERKVNLADNKSGIDFGSGGAATNWSGININQSITFSSNKVGFPKVGFTGRGFSNTGTVYLQNKNNDICFAITVLGATGLINVRKYNGSSW